MDQFYLNESIALQNLKKAVDDYKCNKRERDIMEASLVMISRVVQKSLPTTTQKPEKKRKKSEPAPTA